MIADIKQLMNDRNTYSLCLREQGEITAFAVIKKSSTESLHFKKKMFAVEYIFSMGSFRNSVTNKKMMLDFFRSEIMPDYDMISARVDCGDLSTIHILEQESFRMMDCLITYSSATFRKKIPAAANPISFGYLRNLIAKKSSGLPKTHSPLIASTRIRIFRRLNAIPYTRVSQKMQCEVSVRMLS
ncbi:MULTISPECIES: hypothetical protein [unclassified Methanoregula]|uniref:hypothetical protein n=1 Tax=unclassified Methanoregula TaxID=2649730 RepID=UPI0025C662F9|nr:MULTISPECIES: hypothetical protein [unclassified Methanoregula]